MKKHEKRLYQENAISQQLLLLYILGNTIFTIFYINNADVDFQLGIFILLNVVLSLFAFLMAVRQKMYALQWGYTGIALAVFQFVRVLWIPEEITAPLRIYLIGSLILTAFLVLAGSVICVKRSRERQNYIVENQINLSLLQK